MELDIWQGDWTLPSVDLTCLQVMAYAKFSGAPVKIKKTNWPLSRYGHLPVFRHGKKNTLTTFDNIVSYLQKQNYNADGELTSKQCSDIIAYTALLRDKLYPALLYIWWIDEKNYCELTRPWYAKVLRFPLNYFLPGHQQRAAQTTIDNLWTSDLIDDNQKELSLYKDAQECLTLLSYRLGDNEYFFGNSPCSLDAIVFGYLAPLLKAPFKNAALQNHLKQCPNLTQFVQRILQRYFPLSPEELEALKKKEELEAEEKKEFPHKWRDIILSGIFAAVVMLAYAAATSKISYPHIEDDEYDEEYPIDEYQEYYDDKEKEKNR
ncbi:metaxin-1 [Trichonephila inaurata madagascariensis]|uniref:Metaxin-1 n=1 Tax=Trichonephila inaurata madagascariensis TaxID=2747483 RepID=A0A8X7CRI1_9ARAC|nr:metaxin-1 [Trichonephila inaurata madagascariensis]